MTRRKVYIRADGNANIGIGHVYRSFALADFLKSDFECILIARLQNENLIDEAGKYFSNLVIIPDYFTIDDELEKVSSLVSAEDILVLDGYSFNTAYQMRVKEAGCKLVCIDDIHAYKFVSDVVINHAIGISKADYSLERHTKLFLGPQYALIRKLFLEKALEGKKSGNRQSILICLGGADPTNTTLKVIQAIEQLMSTELHKINVNVVIGAAYQHEDILRAYVNNVAGNISIKRNLSAQQLITLMEECGIAICSPSTITFEYSSVSKGQLFLCKTADNQSAFYRSLIKDEAAKDFFLDFDPKLTHQKEDQAGNGLSNMLDGKQDQRLLDIFHHLSIEF